ncbi:MAG: isoprenoid biosynthesis glyoxalase ElbB [Gammaproteobacteria bacterium]|nr:isoprenoid biosynthesis glyoxalase ElbB [Gammaproteobacteria bacterium]
MMTKVAIILSGAGVFDGSEIYESVITLLRLDQLNVEVQCFAPDIPQMHVINHISGEEMDETRNVLIEAARICRGEIKSLEEAKVENFDALIIPGGFGAAKNLSDFAVKGSDACVQQDVLSFCHGMFNARKPVGLVCIAPAMAPLIFGDKVHYTIGNDTDTANTIEAMGGSHDNCAVNEIVVDDEYMLVTTPAYMLASRISEAAEGINQLVDKVVELSND